MRHSTAASRRIATEEMMERWEDDGYRESVTRKMIAKRNDPEFRKRWMAAVAIGRKRALLEREETLDKVLEGEISDALRGRRIEVMTTNEIAALMKCSRGCISKWEHAKHWPESLGKMMEWAGRLGYDLSVELRDQKGGVVVSSSSRKRGWRRIGREDD